MLGLRLAWLNRLDANSVCSKCGGYLIPYVDQLHSSCEFKGPEVDVTPRMADVLKVFLEDAEQPRYGFELMQLTGQPSGTLYPILAKLERAGWLVGGREDIDARTAGRPPRRFYRIEGSAVEAARVELAALSERYRPPAHSLRRLREGTVQ